MTDNAFTPEQLAQLARVVKLAIREEMADAGLRIDDLATQDEAKEDFRFIRKLRKAWDGGVLKVGNAVLLAMIAIVGTIVGLGFWTWISGGGK